MRGAEQHLKRPQGRSGLPGRWLASPQLWSFPHSGVSQQREEAEEGAQHIFALRRPGNGFRSKRVPGEERATNALRHVAVMRFKSRKTSIALAACSTTFVK